MEPLLVGTTEGFRAIGVGRSKGYGLIAAGELEAVRNGGRTQITTESIRAYVAKLRGQSVSQ